MVLPGVFEDWACQRGVRRIARVTETSLSPCRGFWARHRRKILVSLGVAGAGYAAYRLYDAHRAQLLRVEQLRAREEQAADDLVKNQ